MVCAQNEQCYCIKLFNRHVWQLKKRGKSRRPLLGSHTMVCGSLLLKSWIIGHIIWFLHWKMFFKFRALNHFSFYRFLSVGYEDFFGEYLLMFVFYATHQINKDICFIFRDKPSTYLVIFINSWLVYNPTMEHSNKKKVRKTEILWKYLYE